MGTSQYLASWETCQGPANLCTQAFQYPVSPTTRLAAQVAHTGACINTETMHRIQYMEKGRYKSSSYDIISCVLKNDRNYGWPSGQCHVPLDVGHCWAETPHPTVIALGDKRHNSRWDRNTDCKDILMPETFKHRKNNGHHRPKQWEYYKLSEVVPGLFSLDSVYWWFF